MKYQDWRAGKLLIGLLCILSFGIVAAGFLYYRAYKQHEWVEVETQLHAITDLKKQDLAQWREERMSDGEYFCNNPYLSVMVRQVLDAPQNTSLRNQMQSWLRIIKNHSAQYDRISILNASGEEISSAPNTPAIPSLVIRQNIHSAAKSGKTEFVDFYQNEQDQKIYLAILVPIRGFDTNKVHAFLMLQIDPQQYLYPYIHRWPTRHTTSETLLVRREGSDALYLNGLKYRPKMDLKSRIPLSMKDRPAVKAILGQSGFVVGRDYRGVPVVADVSAIPNSPWFLVARIDEAEAFAPVRARFWEIIISVGILLGIAWLGWGFFWKRQGVQYYREKAEASESLRELNEYLEITLKSIGDGVVVTDAAGLVAGLNPMAENLTGWLMPEAVGHSLTEVFPIINARTRQPVENPIEKVIKTGGLVGLANHTVLISRNSVERQIADSAAPIRDAAGRIRGVVLVFRDVTEEYEAAAALERHRLELKAVYDHAPVMMCAIDANRHILNANHVFSEFAGKHSDLFKGSPVCSVLGCAHASENSRESVSNSACAACPLSSAIEETFRTGAAQRDIEYQASIVHNGERKEVVILCATALVSAAEQSYLLLYLSDITEQKLNESKLRKSMEELQKLVREKEALLREIHHRVKNNLQVISSLLNLESARIDHPGTKMKLREMRNRIRSMALLHETIYSSESLSKIELSVYLERLCRHLRHSLLAHPEFIQLELAIAPVFLDISQAVPCGLLVNELVSNSLKHAFPNDRPGVIRVEVTSLNDGACLSVCVADNGVGLPEDFEQKRLHSLGLQLVSDLAGQIGGKLEITSNPGASFTVTFKPKTESPLELHYE
jgi:PAS domain S-box-containing protein